MFNLSVVFLELLAMAKEGNLDKVKNFLNLAVRVFSFNVFQAIKLVNVNDCEYHLAAEVRVINA